MNVYQPLIDVFRETRGILALELNDFTWSTWRDQTHALKEIDVVLQALEADELPPNLDMIFAPTGDLQEVSLDSGWGDGFLSLAKRFDTAFALAKSAKINR